MIVLDASVLIAYLELHGAHHERAEALLLAEVEDTLAASVVTLAEVLVVPARAGAEQVVRAALADLDVVPLALSGESPPMLARLRATTHLKMPDCCVLLAAEQHAARVATFDARLRAAAVERGLGVVEA